MGIPLTTVCLPNGLRYRHVVGSKRRSLLLGGVVETALQSGAGGPVLRQKPSRQIGSSGVGRAWIGRVKVKRGMSGRREKRIVGERGRFGEWQVGLIREDVELARRCWYVIYTRNSQAFYSSRADLDETGQVSKSGY